MASSQTSGAQRRIEVRSLGREQLDLVATVHRAAFPESALSVLGTETVRRYYDWQLAGPHESVALGAFVDGELGGFCVGGIFRQKMSGYLSKNRWFLAAQLARHPWLIRRAGFRERLVAALRIVKLLPLPKNGVPLYQDSDPTSFGILSIAVQPRHQGLGLGRLLMSEAETVAKRRGFRKMNLSVKVSNHQAIRFYERQEWQRRPSPEAEWNGEMTKCLNG